MEVKKIIEFSKNIVDGKEQNFSYKIGDEVLPVDLIVVGALFDDMLAKQFDTSTKEEIDDMKAHMLDALFGGMEDE